MAGTSMCVSLTQSQCSHADKPTLVALQTVLNITHGNVSSLSSTAAAAMCGLVRRVDAYESVQCVAERAGWSEGHKPSNPIRSQQDNKRSAASSFKPPSLSNTTARWQRCTADP